MQNYWKILCVGLALPVLSIPPSANALSCAAPSLRELYANSEYIYVGYVRNLRYTVDTQSSPEGNGQWKTAKIKATMTPEEVLKGPLPKNPSLHAESFFPEWGRWMKREETVKTSIPFSWFTAEIVPGGRYLVFQPANGDATLGGCSPNQLLPSEYNSTQLRRLRRLRDRATQ